MAVPDTLAAVLSHPAPAGVRQLRGDLLEAGLDGDAPAWTVLDHFYHFLNELAARATSRQYSHFASLLDIGAVGGVAVQNLLGQEGKGELWQRLLAGAFSEGLMVLAARQYVKAWEGEMEATYGEAAWTLYGEWWQLSARMRPDLPAGERRRQLDTLFAPIHDDNTAGTVKAALITRLFQLLLVVQLQEVLAADERR